MTADTAADRQNDVRKMLRSWRKRLGVSQAELARLAGIGQNTLSRYETGERNLSSATLDRLERAIERVFDKREAQIVQAVQSPPKGLAPETVARIRERADTYFNASSGLTGNDDRFTAVARALGIKVPPSPPPTIAQLYNDLETYRKLHAIAARLILDMEKIIELQAEQVGNKDNRIIELEKHVASLREVWTSGTEAALAHEKFERARERVAAFEQPPNESTEDE
jgi:transcriptional regulator with XRE-family HTH domain